MQELTMQELETCEGGTSIVTGLIIIAIGAGIYKIMTSTRGKLSVPKLISFEWRNS